MAGGPSSPRVIVATVTALLSVFVGLAVISHVARTGTAIDHVVLAWMVDHREGGPTAAAIAITNAGSPVAIAVFALVAAAAVWWRMRSGAVALVIVATLAGAAAVSTLAKVIVGSHRPPRAVQLVMETDPSFPSGHVTGTLAMVGILAAVIGRGRCMAVRTALTVAAAAAVVTVAATRLYLGVHWLTDIGGGVLLGCAATLVGNAACAAITGPVATVDAANPQAGLSAPVA
jgi:membrane-associated phospholipid phosphatase